MKMTCAGQAHVEDKAGTSRHPAHNVFAARNQSALISLLAQMRADMVTKFPDLKRVSPALGSVLLSGGNESNEP
jgi:hypothetical protein